MKKMMGVTALMLTLVFMFTGCDFKAEKEYEAKLQTVLQNVATTKQAVDDSMNTVASEVKKAGEISESTFQPVLDKITEAETACKEMAQMEAPEKYKETQELLKQSAEKMQEAYTNYRDGIGQMSSEEPDLTSVTKALTDGDNAMNEAGKLATQAGDLQTKQK